jgi:molybdate transport system substrate-binding protein
MRFSQIQLFRFMRMHRIISQRFLQILSLIFILLTFITLQIVARQQDETELTVFAAASLSDAFKLIGKSFQNTHPHLQVTFNFAGSQQLVLQLTQGAPCDVFVSANKKQMAAVINAGRIDIASVKIFAHNRLVVITPKENARGVKSLSDLGKLKLKIILADKSVPAGQYALEFLDKCSHTAVLGADFRENVLRNVVSYEENVRSVLSKVVLNECDAGIVYTTDAASDTARRLTTITIPDSLNVIAEYPVAAIKDSDQKDIAEEFVRYLCSKEGQSILRNFGFIPVSFGH